MQFDTTGGSVNASKPNKERGRRINDLFEKIRTAKVARSTWPVPEEELTLLELLERHDREAFENLDRTVRLVEAVLDVPLVAVAGLNDQGKSSLVASFLSEDGASRVLRGNGLHQATYRFTLWLPASWREDEKLRKALDHALASVFCHAPEELELAPETARVQQNNNKSLETPLVAWDARLDELKIGLLDCPDIQKRPLDGDEDSIDSRRQLLKKAGSLCAATIFVARHENATTREFNEVYQALPSERRIFAFNQVRELVPHELFVELRDALKLPSHALCFAAYDYDLIHYKRLTPIWDPNLQMKGEGTNRFPCFFRLTERKDDSSPDQISEDRSLHKLAGSLDREALLADFDRSALKRLSDAGLSSLSILETETAKQNKRILEEGTEVWEMCQDALQCPEGQRLILSAEMAQDLADSIIRCAPWYIRVTLQLGSFFKKGKASLDTRLRNLTPAVFSRFGETICFAFSHTKRAFKPAEDAKSEQGQTVQAKFLRSMHMRLRRLGYEIDESDVSRTIERIVERFTKVGVENFAQDKWDKIAFSFWEHAPKGTAARKTAFSVVAALGALIFTAFNPLAGTVLFHFMLGKAFLALTLKELFVAVGVGALVHGKCAIDLQSKLERELGPMQLNRFFAVACDELGLPRDDREGGSLDTGLPVSVNRNGLYLQILKLRREELNNSVFEELKGLFEELKKQLEGL